MFGKNKKTDNLTEQEKASRTVNRMLTLAFVVFIGYTVMSGNNDAPVAPKVVQGNINTYELQVLNAALPEAKTLQIQEGGEAEFKLSHDELKKMLAMPKDPANINGPNLVAFKIKLMQKAVDNKVPSTVTP
jgi:hypothetical protein